MTIKEFIQQNKKSLEKGYYALVTTKRGIRILLYESCIVGTVVVSFEKGCTIGFDINTGELSTEIAKFELWTRNNGLAKFWLRERNHD